MPEENPVNNMTDDADISRTDETENTERVQYTKSQKMRNIVQSFFSRPKSLANYSSSKIVDKKNNDKSQIHNLMSEKVNNNPHKVILSEGGNEGNLITLNGAGKNRACSSEINLNENNGRLFRRAELKTNGRPFEKYSFMAKSLEELRSKHDDKSDIFLKNVGVKHLEEISKFSTRKSKESNIGAKTVEAETGHSSLSESLKNESEEINRRLLRCRIQRSFSADDDSSRSKKTNFLLNMKNFMKKNVRNLRMPRLQSGAVIISNEKNTNVTFSKFEPDMDKIIVQTRTFERVATNPDLMCGGIVVLEGFAEMFKVPNIYEDDPLIIDVISNDIHIPELRSLETKSPETSTFAKCLSGGKVIDNSSKGATLPELYPLKQTGYHCPSAKRQLGGDAVNSWGFENEIFVDLLKKTLRIRETKKSNIASADIFMKQHFGNDAPYMLPAVGLDVPGSNASASWKLQEKNQGESVLHTKPSGSIVPCTSKYSDDSADKFACESSAYSL